MAESKAIQLPIHVLMKHIHPGWDESVFSQYYGKKEGQFFIPWETSPHPSAFGASLHIDACETLIHWTLSPDVADENALQEVSLGDLPDHTSLNHRLLLGLRQAQNRLKTYVHHFPGVVYQQRKDLTFGYVAPTCQSRLGFDPAPFAKHSNQFLRLLMPTDRDYYLRETEKHSNKDEAFSLTYRIHHPKDGNIVYLLDVRTPIRTRSGLLLGYEGVWLDVTRQEVAEKRLTSADWKESLATLTSGLLHDFKNSITGIRTLTEIYHQALDPDHRWFEGMKMIHQSALSAQSIVQRIIDLNREEFGKKNYFNLSDLLKEQIDLLRFLLPKHMRIDPDLADVEIPVYLDEVGFRQLILNLFINARDASPYDGQIRITLDSINADETILTQPDGSPLKANKDGALIEVIDYGSGVPPEYIAKVFNPFFTTKEVSKGSGLGLYNARLFIEDHGGRIGLVSQIEKGTVVSIFIPAADFTETWNSSAIPEESSEDETSSRESKRNKIVLFSRNEPTDFLENLRDSECDVLAFNEPSQLHRHLETSPEAPRLLVLMSPDRCNITDSIITKVSRDQPDLRMVHVHPPIDKDFDFPDHLNLFELESSPGENDKRLILQLIELMK